MDITVVWPSKDEVVIDQNAYPANGCNFRASCFDEIQKGSRREK